MIMAFLIGGGSWQIIRQVPGADCDKRTNIVLVSNFTRCPMNRRSMLAMSAASLLLTPSLAVAEATSKPTLDLVKDPYCGCCIEHAEYLRAKGFVVNVRESEKLAEMRKELGVSDELAGCHMIFADNDVIEGHVPAAAIEKLLAERPAIKGISVPGMPLGSPGMGGEKTKPLVVLTIQDGIPRVFHTE